MKRSAVAGEMKKECLDIEPTTSRGDVLCFWVLWRL